MIKAIKDVDRPEICPACQAASAQRLIAPKIAIHGASDWDKTHFDPALGCVVRGDQHRREIAKERGLQEVGTEPPEKLHSYYENKNRELREESWSKA